MRSIRDIESDLHSDPVANLRDKGFAVLRGLLSQGEVAELRSEIERIFQEPMTEDDKLYGEHWRMLLFERSELCQRMIEHPGLLSVVEPILGKDCHVIANAGWMTPAGYDGGGWHTDSGPHVPRDEGIDWDERIPYPIFAIGVMLYLTDVPLESGPTAVVPGSHKSGRPVPQVEEPTYKGEGPVALESSAGDAALFSSDAWHRGLPHTGGEPRIVWQVHYGRRDIAPRYRPYKNQRLPEEVVARAGERGKRLIGIHPIGFYG
jgi:ectoine hydroxylase-related dioxygenase (phytanoyl-CoA dioxygenase family)